MNPVEEFLEEVGEEKQAFLGAMKGFGQAMQSGMQSGLGMAAGTAVLAGGAVAASKLYDAATKKRDFNKMMEYNPHLQEAHAQDPKMFNQMYTSLRGMNPSFAKDPLVAGRYMSRMIDEPLAAGGVLAESSGALPSGHNQFFKDVAQAGREGFGKGMSFKGKPSAADQLSEMKAQRQLAHMNANPDFVPGFGGGGGRGRGRP